ncbi:MAG TPA: type II toxin-antitoxin system VapC family toxin [Rickettsia endosymbiont of Bembidion nr. Transversale]|nr:type II toxin-antitoxin system VapC family toxin [Rickettsia endosymbiont of Bembidion nr. Transversale]
MASFVLDASITLSWFMLNEKKQYKLLDKAITEGAIVPIIWGLEISNSLLYAERRGRIDVSQRQSAIYLLKEIGIKVDRTSLEHIWSETMDLAERHCLTIYDASYLELALRYDLPLATLDKALKLASRQEKIITL